MPRINLASNTNRGLLKVVMASDHADLKQLTQFAKDKLRLKGIKGFYAPSGRELVAGAQLDEDTCILVHRGEAFVGKAIAAPSDLPSAEQRPLPPSVDSAFPRSWMGGRPAESAAARLRVMSFNILAPCLAQGTEAADMLSSARGARSYGVYPATKVQGVQLSHNFSCPPSVLAWEQRFPRLRHELTQYSPDLICLQELDATSSDDVQRALRSSGYCQGVFAKAMGGATNFVGMFWREDRLRAMGEPEIVYLKAQGTIAAIVQRLRTLPTDVEQCICCQGRGQDAYGVCPLCDGVGSFSDDDEALEFVAVTTHLKAGLKLKDEQERTKQAVDLLGVLDKMVGTDDSVVFTGDFNAHVEDLPFSEPASDGSSNLPGLVLPRLLRSGLRCAVREVTGGEPLAFSQWCWRCDVEIKSVIDHILLRGPDVAACAALAAPADAEVVAAGGLPNARHPSDHIPIVVDLSFKARDPRQAPQLASSLTGLAARGCISERDLLGIGQGLPQTGRVALTEDGFKYVLLPKEWQAARQELVDGAAAFYMHTRRNVLEADRTALQRNLTKQRGVSQGQVEWGFWTPPSCVGIHISLGKHANSVDVGRRVRFQVKRLLDFQTRKLGAPSSSPDGQGLFCARWFTFEVTLVDEVRCEGEEPHVSFAIFGARRPEESQP